MSTEQVLARHVKHGPWPIDHCGYCLRDRNNCRRKISFPTREEADEWIKELNETRGYIAPVIRYRCRWCDGYHMSRAKRKHQRERARRQERKWRIRLEVQRRETQAQARSTA